MNDQPQPRMFLHLSELPYSLRSLFAGALLVLGLAYLFAAANLYVTYAGKAGGTPTVLTYEDVVAAYAGGKASAIEDALNGPMSPLLTAQEKGAVLAWARAGASQASYLTDVKPIVDLRCLTCHGGSDPQRVDLSTYEGVKAVAAGGGGESAATRIRDSHIHLFGMTFLFFVMGLMFSHACLRPVWLKSAVISAPFALIAIDVASTDLIRFWRPLAAATIASGVAMAACFAFMWLVTVCQLWFFRPPAALLLRLGGDLPEDAA